MGCAPPCLQCAAGQCAAAHAWPPSLEQRIRFSELAAAVERLAASFSFRCWECFAQREEHVQVVLGLG